MTNDCKKKTTARTTGLTGNRFASVEQGRSYVLSVHSPSGAGEIELLAADSDQQSEPDMFSMLYEKIETARQIPFIAISPFVFVNVGSSDVQWLVTPANFSLAVPGVSSGGGESFDPASDQEITGNWTFAGAVNANGGINIPLAVGAPTSESGVNRLYAAGMGGASNIYTAAAFLNTDSLTTTGTVTITKTVPWQMARIGIPAGAHTTIQAPFEGPSSQWNYSSWAGFSFVWRSTAAAKVTMGFGRGAKTIRTDLTTDSYTIIPGNGLAFNFGEILDITFDNVRDTARNGYTVRVREIYALNSTDGWQVKTTTSFIPATQNEPIPWTVCKIIYQQQAVASSSVYENLGGLWLMVTGAQTNNLYKIATCRGVSNFETGVGISRWVTDVINTTSGTAAVNAGPGEYAYYQPGNINPLFYGLDAIGTNAIESEETADFEDINIPL